MASEPILVALDLAAVRRGQSQRASVLSDYWALTKPEVNFLIALATLAAFWTGSPKPLADFPWLLGLYTLLGTVFVASGAGTLNQVIERGFDTQMRRTARRPIAAGRIQPTEALVFGALLSFAGVVYLALVVSPAASVLALLTLGGYLFLYTPLKRRTPWCTLVGAFPGAMPVLIGYVAAAEKLDSPAWLLYAVSIRFLSTAAGRLDHRRSNALVHVTSLSQLQTRLTSLQVLEPSTDAALVDYWGMGCSRSRKPSRAENLIGFHSIGVSFERKADSPSY